MRLEAIVRLRPGGAAMLAAFAVLAAWQPVIAQNSRRLQPFTREQSLVLAESESVYLWKSDDSTVTLLLSIVGAVATGVTHQEADTEAEAEPAARTGQEPRVLHKELLLALIGVVFLLIGINGGGYKVWRITIPEMDLLARGRAASVGVGLLILGLILHLRNH
jgi:hypothetical protein